MSLPFSIYGSKIENPKMSVIGQNSPKKGSKNVVFMVILFERFSGILKSKMVRPTTKKKIKSRVGKNRITMAFLKSTFFL